MALHDGEYRIDEPLVRRLLTDQMPLWAHLPLRRLETSGTANVAYRLGSDKLIRLPRTEEFSKGPLREATWLPRFGPELPLGVPRYLALGIPTEAHPSHWSVLEWIEGTTADASTLDVLREAAATLGEFVVALRRVPTEGAPAGGNYRASGLARADDRVRHWVDRLPDDIDRNTVLRIWQACLSAGEWTGPPTWLHGDLKGDNLIARGGELIAVIDWEGCTVGDPSADYLGAWWLFDRDSRETFRTACRAPSSDWLRGMGWALHMAVAAIPYYTDTNPRFAAQARAALSQIIQSDEASDRA